MIVVRIRLLDTLHAVLGRPSDGYPLTFLESLWGRSPSFHTFI
jgi:hypothetical protein